MFQVTTHGFVSVGIFLIIALFGGLEDAYAQCGTCITGQYKYCDGDCPKEHTQQGECTTRYDPLCNPQKWCCCSNDYRPDDVGGETTPGGPPGSIGPCPVPDGPVPDEDKPLPWAVSAAVKKTPDPTFTDNVLRLVRDNVLRKNERGQKYVELVYKFSGDVDQISSTNPSLVTETTALLNENLSLLLKLANGQKITISKSKIDQALALLEKYSNAAGKNVGLRRAITNATSGLKDKQFLMKLGIQVKN